MFIDLNEKLRLNIKRHVIVRILLIALIITLGFTNLSSAASCDSNESTKKFDNLSQSLKDSLQSESTWSIAWGSIWAATTAAQLALIPIIKDNDTKVDLAFGAASSGLGLIPTFILRPRILKYKSQIENANCTDTSTLENILTEDENDKKNRRGFYPHLANVLVNLGLGAIQAFVIKHKQAALITTLAGIPTGILMIETQPRLSLPRFGVLEKLDGISLTFSF